MNERRFTVQALRDSDILSLAVPELERMRAEFPDLYQELYTEGHNRYKGEKKTMK